MADQDGGGFAWFLAGLGVGGLIGVLYAPKAGSEIREDLKAKAEQGKEYVRGRARDAADQASGWVDKGRDAVGQQKDQFRAAYEAGKQAYQEATSEPAPANKI